MTDSVDITVQRSLQVSPEAVWHAWTTSDEVARWWWPARFQTSYAIDLREGGWYRYITASIPEMGVLELSGQFETVEPPHRLVYIWQWAWEDTASHVSVDFSATETGTDLHVRHGGLATQEERENHVVGWNDCLARLEVHLKGD